MAPGKLTNQFLVVSNISPDDASAVIGGNERVVRPRLADAKFFFDQDRKKTLESRVAGLDKVVYHNKLGTQGERAERVRAIARDIAQQLGGEVLAEAADTAAQLAKTDLLTDMVGEFPELQGIMGGYYARHDGLSDDVADAIEDHYKPRFAGDALPRNPRWPGGGAGRQARNPGGHVRHWQLADGRQRPVCTAPPRLGRDPHAGRERSRRCRCASCRPMRSRCLARRHAATERRHSVGGLLCRTAQGSCESRVITAQEVDAVIPAPGMTSGVICQASGGGARLCCLARGRRPGGGQQAHRQHSEESARGRRPCQRSACSKSRPRSRSTRP